MPDRCYAKTDNPGPRGSTPLLIRDAILQQREMQDIRGRGHHIDADDTSHRQPEIRYVREADLPGAEQHECDQQQHAMMPHRSQSSKYATTEHATQKACGREDSQAASIAMEHLLGEDGQYH